MVPLRGATSLAGRLARRVMERWAVRLALWLDRQGAISEASRNFGAVLRLFGLERFRDGQLPVVEAALKGQSMLVVSPAGFGKTLCFQLPAVLRQGASVVVCPLKALMSEQVSALLRLKIPSTFNNSDLDGDEKRLRYKLLAKTSFKLLYAAPERFFVKNESELRVLRSIRPAFLVIDEAHCIDQWGRDFRPEYGRLREVREALGSPPVLAFRRLPGWRCSSGFWRPLEWATPEFLSAMWIDPTSHFFDGRRRPLSGHKSSPGCANCASPSRGR